MWMNRREVELVNLMVFVGGVPAFSLLATDDPKSTFFGFFKRVHMVLKTVNESFRKMISMHIEDDLLRR